MSNEERTKLEAYASGQNLPKRRSPKRKKLKPKEQVQAVKKQPPNIERERVKIQETHNIVFQPNEGPQTDFFSK